MQELVIGDQSGIIHIWNLQTDQSEQLIPEPGISIQSISIDPQGLYMAAINNKGNCYVWALSGGGPKQSSQLHPKNKILAHKKYGLCCKFSPDSQYLVTSAADHKIKIWRTSDFSLVMELTCDSQRWWEHNVGFTVNIEDCCCQGLGPGVHRRQSVRHVSQLGLSGAALEYEDRRTEERISGSSESFNLPRLQRS